jgi:hypothetical protein
MNDRFPARNAAAHAASYFPAMTVDIPRDGGLVVAASTGIYFGKVGIGFEEFFDLAQVQQAVKF